MLESKSTKLSFFFRVLIQSNLQTLIVFPGMLEMSVYVLRGRQEQLRLHVLQLRLTWGKGLLCNDPGSSKAVQWVTVLVEQAWQPASDPRARGKSGRRAGASEPSLGLRRAGVCFCMCTCACTYTNANKIRKGRVTA